MLSGNTRQKGFTLIELLIVVVILGVLAALAIPMYTNKVAEARRSTCLSNMQLILSSAMLYGYENNGAVPKMADLVTAGHLRAELLCPQGQTQYTIAAPAGVLQVTCSNATSAEHVLP